MRKIWIVVPFGRSQVSRDLFIYVSRKNESLLNSDAFEVLKIAEKYNCKVYSSITLRDKFEIRSDNNSLICIVKQIEVNLQDFPTVPNAEIKV